VLQCFAEGPDGELYLYREIYHTQRIVDEHARQIMSIVTKDVVTKWYDHFNKVERERTDIVWIEPKPSAIICDHDAEGRRTFEKATGLGTQAAIKNVYEGIDAVKKRLIPAADGMPRLYVMQDALVEKDQWLVDHLLPTCTEQEYAGYVWHKSPDGRIQDEPVKLDDHGMDGTRYLTMFKDFKGKARATLINS